MITLSANSANELFSAACHAVLDRGRIVSPRGMKTVELMNVHLRLAEPRRRYIDIPPHRVINPAFAVAESMWILSGSDEDWIFTYNRALRQYADNGRLQGAYGPRLRNWGGAVDQLGHVRSALASDPGTRQAVIQLYDPLRDTRGHRDIPCTLGYRFFIRNDRLHMHTTMRSQDLWLGFPYDIFTTTLMHELLAHWLGVDVGEYHHFADSLHIYQEHMQAARSVPQTPLKSPSMDPLVIAWEAFDQILSSIITGTLPASASPEWISLADVMASYRTWVEGDRHAAIVAASDTVGALGRALERWYTHLQSADTSHRS